METHTLNVLKPYIEMSARIAKEHGWDEKKVSAGEFIALCHSELSEALEEYRESKNTFYYSGASIKPEGFAVELADVLIRIFHYCGQHDLPLEEALKAKLAYNETRSYRHGGKIL